MSLFRNRFVYLSVITLVCVCFSSASAEIDYDIWQAMQQADQYEQAGKLADALPLWLTIIDYFEKGQDESSWTNAAMYHKKAGKYYDSIKDYDKAIYHYEKENEFWEKLGKDWGTEDMLRADQIRTVFDIYVETAPDNNRKLAKYEPRAGYYNGIYCEHDSNIGQNLYLTRSVYGHHTMFLFYEEWGNMYDFDYGVKSPFDIKMAERIKNEGAGFQQALNSSVSGLEIIKEDAWITAWAKAARESGVEIFLRFLPEMNGDWAAWAGDPVKYKDKFRLVHDIMERLAPNVVMVWCPNDVPVELHGHRIEDYYPGDEYVDWVGVNFYVDYYNSGDASKPDNRLQNPLDHLKYVYNMFHERKPIMICETGVSHYSITTGEDLTEWAVANLEKLYSMLPVVYPDVKAITYFSMDQGSPFYNNHNTIWNNYRLSDNKRMADTYRELMKSASIVHKIGGSAGFTYKKIRQSELPLYKKIIFDIKIADYKISKVEIFIDDNLVKVDSSLPFSLEYNLAFADKLKVKVYGSDGLFAMEREIVLNSKDTSLNGAYLSGFGTGMEFCKSGISTCDHLSQTLAVPNMETGRCQYVDSQGNIQIPCMWLGNGLFGITLGLTSTSPDIIADLAGASVKDAGSNVWFWGYQQGVEACLDDIKGCSDSEIKDAFINVCAEFDLSTNRLVMPCMSGAGSIYNTVMELFSIDPVQLRLVSAEEVKNSR